MAFPTYTQTYHKESYPAISPTRPELSTAGKVVFITGGGSGIGPRIAHAFATAGSTEISILGRTASSLFDTKKEIEAAHAGTKVHTSVADILDASAVEAAFAGVEKEFGKKVDICVSNAGYLPDNETIADGDIDEWFKGM
ncbi:hypothetical protein BP6252_01046 [Coleophoma cylindrospora]|uniref:Uncharacterized protein n=1 Tax=Coleophoma cylindrospora TaxID=1849047 RepID=A0A3D8SS08_9HELO|nr:hypothetical protein BP6252_01046 [Coleophoma cylindrospora]